MNKQLIDRIHGRFQEYKFKDRTEAKAMPILERLGEYYFPALEHSFRVAEIGAEIACLTYTMDKKDVWLPGIMHDIGKLGISLELLTKSNHWTEEDRIKMEKHVEIGCRMLAGLLDFSALAVFYSHYFKREGGYPTDEDLPVIFGERYDKWHEQNKFKAILCGRWINLADEYDATRTRRNDHFSPGIPKLLTPEEVRRTLIKNNQDQIILIERLYEIGIFN